MKQGWQEAGPIQQGIGCLLMGCAVAVMLLGLGFALGIAP